MEQISNPQISSFILHNYRHFLNGNNESIEKLGTEDLKIPKFNEEDLIDLCDSAIITLKKLNKTLLYIPSPSIVIGDLHGNLHDLIRLMNSIIDIFSNRVLFLGDYIDRGQFQLETITILLALRIEYPEHFFLIRGNHEFASVNAYGGFKDEILQSGYSEALYNKINETFSWLPIAAVINDHIFCVHGGLSPLFHEIKQIETEFKLPIVNIYTSSSNPYKKRNKLSENSSSSRVANVSLRSSLNNVNATLNTNMSFFKADRTKPRFSDSSEFKTTAQNVKLGQEPNINSNIKSHPPKFLPLCKKSNFEFPINRKLPPLGTKSPLPSLPDVKPSISPSTNLNSELENSIASFPIAAPQNQGQPSQQASIISQMQNSAQNLSAATDQQQQQNSQQSVQTAISQNQNSIPPLPNSQNQTTNSPMPNTNSQNQNVNSPLLNSNSQNQNVNSPLLNSNSQNQNSIPPIPNSNSQNQNVNLSLLNSNSQNQNSIPPLSSSLENSANSTSNSSLENENLVPSLCPKASSSPPLNMSAFYISSSQLEMMTKYKETVLKDSEMNDDKNNTDLLTDLMWSDPTNSCELFLPSNRGSGCYFGYVITNHFLKKNGMKMIVRGHESVKRGIEKNHEKKVVTIYSSSSLRQGVLAGCAIFDIDDSFTEFRLIPISTVQRSEAKFFSPKAKQNNNNKPLKLNSFSRSQSIFGNVKKLRKNMKGSNHQSVNSSPDYNDNMIPDICTIKEEEGESILEVPLSRYEKDFTFVVNGDEFVTSQIIADLLSPNISKARISDPTIKEFYINTRSRGDFQQIIDLVNFKQQAITSKNDAFVFEILEQLGTTNIEINYSYGDITLDNVIMRIKRHESNPFYENIYSEEIQFFSSHFINVISRKKEEFLTISTESLENILSSNYLALNDEDELLSLILELYTNDHKKSKLFEYIEFTNISLSKMHEFIEIFDVNDLTHEIWKSISNRLETDLKSLKKREIKGRYKSDMKIEKGKEIIQKEKEFEGIINELKKNFNIKNEIDITCSFLLGGNSWNIIEYEDESSYFYTSNSQNSWICIEFRKHRIIPTSYTIMSSNDYHPQSWVIEGSVDNKNWEILSEEKDNKVFSRQSIVHSFPIQNQSEHEVKFIRLRQTGKNSNNSHHLYFSAIEFYGRLI